jgi:hypothetical protein
VEIGEVGVKDVILPGDVRELLNKAWKRSARPSQPDPAPGGDGGNAVSAQHGTAIEDNPLLLRLKELEALEKLVEKVGRI